MNRSGHWRTVVATIVVLSAGASLAACASEPAADHAAPAASSTAGTEMPSPTGGASMSTASQIQDDLNSANNATTDAAGDVADADSSAATSDSP